MKRILIAGAMSAAALSLTFSANAQARVEISHNVYHVAVCPGPVPLGTARCFAHVVTDRSGRILPGQVRPNTTPSGYGPSDLYSAYKITTTGSSSTIIAIVDADGYTNAESDLGVYRSQFGLPPCTSANGCFAKFNQNGVKGSYPKQNTGWAQETALDLDMASAMCPNCRIYLVEANSATFGNLATAENTAAALGAHVISNSYGGGESGSQSYEPAYNHPGVAVIASSGDGGYAGGVQFPASSPHVTAAGGTSLSRASNSRGWTETVWSGAGSGCSSVYNKPTWQTDPLCGMRMVADVSAVADPYTGVAVYGPINQRSSGWQVYGGTSVASPLIGGIYANNGGSVTYGSNPYSNQNSLFDVTSGSNGSCGGTYFCTGEIGYDGPSGLGTPDGNGAF
jgi:subtilase family serine protease